MDPKALIPKQEPLAPSGCVRLAIFWAPALVSVAALARSPRFQGLGGIWRLLLGGTTALTALCATAWHAASWQLKPLPTDGEVEAMGGKRFRRPSDGKVMEYWLSGQAGSKTAVVFCHRMDGKLGADYGRVKVEEVLRSQRACLLSPSVPSLSASPPYDTDRPTEWLRQWTQDMMHLLRELGAEHVYVLGLSWGVQLCLSLAMACQEKGLLRGVALIGGSYWDTKLVQYKASDDAGGEAMKGIFSRPAVVRPMAYLMVRPMLSSMGDVSKMLPEKELVHLREHFGGDLAQFGEGMIRSTAHFLHQFWQVGCLAGRPDEDHFVDLSAFDPAIPMHVNLGKEDTLAQQQQPFLDQVEHAELKMFEGSHAGFPLGQIIQNLMAPKA